MKMTHLKEENRKAVVSGEILEKYCVPPSKGRPELFTAFVFPLLHLSKIEESVQEGLRLPYTAHCKTAGSR